jgi:hypothetical protein
MSGIHLALLGMNFGEPAPTVIGQAYGGGFWTGDIGVAGVATHHLVIAPKSTGQNEGTLYKNAQTAVPGADSDIDGPQNTADMIADGNSTVYPAAHFCNNLSIGGYTDWYMPAKNELEINYFNLKPGTQPNSTGSGINPNAIPARATPYTTSPSVPSQTSATIFQTGNAEAFTISYYFSSTDLAATTCANQYLGPGLQNNYNQKNNTQRVRAVRRVPV